MADFTRNLFGLTQERLASWLGVNRTTLALAETNRRSLPFSRGLQDSRLTLAGLGQVMAADGTAQPAPPPLPAPRIVPAPLEHRLADCRYQLFQLRHQLKKMQAKAAQLEARLAALPALRAYPGPVKNPAREAGWLALFEGEAVDGLRDDCGAGPQCLLQARIAGLEHEAALLQETLSSMVQGE